MASLLVYVADSWNNRIQKFTKDGRFLSAWGSYGSGDGQFNYPRGIAIDTDGLVYVADSWNNRIQKFTKDGQFLSAWGSEGSGDGQFNARSLPRTASFYPHGEATAVLMGSLMNLGEYL